MSARTPEMDPAQIREYLLRRMPDSVRARFEEAYFRDDGLLDRIEAEEDRLVTDYVLGRLDESDRRRFEKSLLGMPYYQERVQTTSQLNLRVARLRYKPRPRPDVRNEKAEADHLFPGGSGWAVAFAVLAVLFAAAVVTSIKLKSEVDKAARGAAAAPAPAPPAAEALLFDRDAQGPQVRKVLRKAPLLVVVPRRLLPASSRDFRLLVVGPKGDVAWESPVTRLADVPAGADLSIALPAGVPAAGRSSLVVKAGGVFDDALVPLGVLELEEPKP